MSEAKKLLFVCMGNICRSPTAEAVMQHKVKMLSLQKVLSLDSAGTHAYHIGEQSDPRSRATARDKGIDMEFIRARKISVLDYDQFDWIYAMDSDNLELIEYYAPDNHGAQIELFLAAANRAGTAERRDVPDPYYGGNQGFEDVFDLVGRGCDAILQELV
ncbi:MAG: low molecular weight protein-tyrosine-phosphatase [Pseudomonadota bacterium]